MDTGKRKTVARNIVIAGVAVMIIIFFILLGPMKMLAKSDSPEFCVKCHVMGSEYESWMHEGAHRRKQCVDCHLPNGNEGVHYTWKAIDGLKDVLFFYSGRVPEHIALTSHGADVLQANCIRCHAAAVEFINHERKCWECHRRLMHTRSGLIETH